MEDEEVAGGAILPGELFARILGPSPSSHLSSSSQGKSDFGINTMVSLLWLLGAAGDGAIVVDQSGPHR